MKWTITILLLMIVGNVLADEGSIETYKPNQIIDLSIYLTNQTGEILNANCSIQIKNSTFSTLIDDSMNYQSGGWYNYTYNTSKTGKYHCRQNCTSNGSYSSNVCNFIIKGDENLAIAIGLLMLGASFFFVWVGLSTDAKQHFGLKLFFMLLGSTIMVASMYFAYRISIDNGSSSAVQIILLTFFQIGMWAVILFFIYVFLYIVFKSIMMYKEMKWK